MGVNARIVDLNELFLKSSADNILINHFNISSNEDVERLNRLIYTHFDGDLLNVTPSCDCRETQGGFYVDTKCEVCGTVVKAVTERKLETVLWMQPPEGVTAFINPHVWSILSDAMTHGGFNLLEYLCNPMQTLPPHQHENVRKFLTLGLERGINAFHANFDEYMQKLFDAGLVNDGKRNRRSTLREFLRLYRHCIFTQYLPVPSKLSLITEQTVTKTYYDTSILPVIDAIRTISATVNSPTPLTPRMLQARSVKANALMAKYYREFISGLLSSKTGLMRKHVFGSRLHFTFRAVITSLSDAHDYDELHLPWSLAVMAFELHLTAKLLRRGYTPVQCSELIQQHVLQYHPLLDELFKELIAEGMDGGIRVTLGRNPTLLRGSIQSFRVTRVKPDPRINSISISVLCLKAPNADFDGDALNGMIILDRKMYNRMARLAPHLGVMDLKKNREISKNIIIPAPVIDTIGSWFDGADQ